MADRLSDVGSFEGAIKPQVDTFRSSLPILAEMLRGKEKEPVLMFCTGGIRCVKAGSYLVSQGFEDIRAVCFN